MSRRTSPHVRVEQSGQGTSPGIVRAHLLATDGDRLKHIDRYIDYFGGEGPRRTGVNLDPCGESLLGRGRRTGALTPIAGGSNRQGRRPSTRFTA